MDIKEQVAAQNRVASQSGESFRVDQFERLQADFKKRFEPKESPRCTECGQ